MVLVSYHQLIQPEVPLEESITDEALLAFCRTIPIASQLDPINKKMIVLPVAGKVLAASVQFFKTQQKRPSKAFFNPPIGPIPAGFECAACGQRGVVDWRKSYHMVECVAPIETSLRLVDVNTFRTEFSTSKANRDLEGLVYTSVLARLGIQGKKTREIPGNPKRFPLYAKNKPEETFTNHAILSLLYLDGEKCSVRISISGKIQIISAPPRYMRVTEAIVRQLIRPLVPVPMESHLNLVMTQAKLDMDIGQAVDFKSTYRAIQSMREFQSVKFDDSKGPSPKLSGKYGTMRAGFTVFKYGKIQMLFSRMPNLTPELAETVTAAFRDAMNHAVKREAYRMVPETPQSKRPIPRTFTGQCRMNTQAQIPGGRERIDRLFEPCCEIVKDEGAVYDSLVNGFVPPTDTEYTTFTEVGPESRRVSGLGELPLDTLRQFVNECLIAMGANLQIESDLASLLGTNHNLLSVKDLHTLRLFLNKSVAPTSHVRIPYLKTSKGVYQLVLFPNFTIEREFLTKKN